MEPDRSAPHPSPAFRRILVGTDFSPVSKRAFRTGLALARQLGAELHLLHVRSSPNTRAVFFMTVSRDHHEAVASRFQAKIRKRFEDFLRGEELGTLAVREAFLEGQPHREVVAYARREEVDLIVVGERPESRAQHLLQHLAFESVGERVRREAPCAVLTVR